jgi:hypothetical protein
MILTHVIGEDFKGRQLPVFLFECEKSEKDVPKVAGFQFGIHGGILEPANRWTTPDRDVAKKLIQYADGRALEAFRASGLTDLERARRNAVKREKTLACKERNELASMSREERLSEVRRWLGFAEKDAREKGYVSANCTNRLRKLRGFLDPEVEARYDAAVAKARVVSALKNTGRHLEKLKAGLRVGWHTWSATAVEEAVMVLRRAGELAAADGFETELRRLRECFNRGRITAVPKAAFPFSLTRGGGAGGLPFRRDGIVRNTAANLAAGQPEWLTVCREGRKYVAHRGLEQGVGAERGYLYWADCREADPRAAKRAAAEWEARRRWEEQRAAALAEWRSLAATVCREGVHPAGPLTPQGQLVEHPLVDAEQGDCFVIGNDAIWHVQANPAEGAHRQLNNVRLGRREAIGHRVPLSLLLEMSILGVVATLTTPRAAGRGDVDFNQPHDSAP